MHWQTGFAFKDDKNTSMAKKLQIMKKTAMAILWMVKGKYKIDTKRLRYGLSSDFENGIGRMLSVLDIDHIEKHYRQQGVLPG